MVHAVLPLAERGGGRLDHAIRWKPAILGDQHFQVMLRESEQVKASGEGQVWPYLLTALPPSPTSTPRLPTMRTYP